MKPIPALIVFIAGLVTGTAITFLALRPTPTHSSTQTSTTQTGAPRAARPTDGSPRHSVDAGNIRDAGDDVGEVNNLGEVDDLGELDANDAATGAAATATVQTVDIAHAEITDHDAWAKQGFVKLQPPVRLPTDGAERDIIEVWLRVPQGAAITARTLADGRRTIRFPPGTVADRVERWGYAKDANGAWRTSVTDVRGTRLDQKTGAEMFHVFAPTGPQPGAPLIGWEWQRGNELEQNAATSLLVKHLEKLDTIQDAGRTPSPVERRRFVNSFRRNNACAKCHAHNKPTQIESARGIHRATDDNGFYVPLSVLMSTVPLERHRARDMNAGDPFLTFTCPNGEGAVLAERGGGARDFRCLQGGAPVGTLDVKRALAANDPRTLALCESRKYLRDRMDAAARALFQDAFAECGL